MSLTGGATSPDPGDVPSADTGGRLEVETRLGRREPVDVLVEVLAAPDEREGPVHVF
jgi:hypothetical protein